MVTWRVCRLFEYENHFHLGQSSGSAIVERCAAPWHSFGVAADLSPVRAAFEEAVEAYVIERRARLPTFIANEFGPRATYERVRHTARYDLWKHPVNLLLAVASLTARKVASLSDKLGFEWFARLLYRIPLPIPTDYQASVQQSVVTDWLELGDEANPLRAKLAADPRVRDASLAYPELTTALTATQKLRKQLRIPLIGYVENRTTVMDLAASGTTLFAAWAIFGESGLSPADMVNRLAGTHANTQAANHFFLGHGAGRAFHKLFPVEPTSWEIVLSALVIFLGLSALTIAVVLLSDPLLKKLGSHHRQLDKLLEAFSSRLLLDVRLELKAIETPSEAKVVVPSNVAERVLETASHLATLTQVGLQRTGVQAKAFWQGAQPHVVQGLRLARGQSAALWRRFLGLPPKWRLGVVVVVALFVVSVAMVRVQGKESPRRAKNASAAKK